jgi:hypothetical protein
MLAENGDEVGMNGLDLSGAVYVIQHGHSGESKP